jgi:hypothetical protein
VHCQARHCNAGIIRTYCDGVWERIQGYFSVRVFEVAMLFEDVITTQTDMNSLFTVHAPDLESEGQDAIEEGHGG